MDPQQTYGVAAALLPDVNGDGFPDVALGTRSSAQGHIFLGGRNGFAPAPFATVSVPPAHSNLLSQGRCTSLNGANDLNGDGIPDLLIGTATFMNVHSNQGAGNIRARWARRKWRRGHCFAFFCKAFCDKK